MKLSRLILPLSALVLAAGYSACDDDVSQIGGSITKGEITISVDSTDYDLHAVSVVNNNYDSRSGNLLLGNIDVEEYGRLNCSFVSRLLCVTSVPQADTVPVERVDSCILRLVMARTDITGDSLAPQQVTVYKLNKQLPDNITNQFDPTGYYDPSTRLGRRSYTISEIAKSDSAFVSDGSVGKAVDIKLPVELGRDLFTKYKNEPEIFQWPQTFAQYFPGLYVESSFGRGCVANIYYMYMYVFFHTPDEKKTTVDGETVTTKYNRVEAVTVCSNAAMVLSSNNISYSVSDKIKDLIANGETVITTPGGYVARFNFPIQDIIDDYKNKDHNLSIISNLSMTVPAEKIDNDFNIGAAPYMLMIKTSEIDSFFKNNKIPDNKTSFYATYDSTNKRYVFSGLRPYLLNLLDKENISDDDVDFSLIPVSITQEKSTTGYGQTVFYVSKCVPYTATPTMTRMHMEKAKIVFTFSSQVIE